MVPKRAEMVSYAFALYMSREIQKSPLFVLGCRLDRFSSVLEYKRKTSYKRETKLVV